jgi:hypothetical protein
VRPSAFLCRLSRPVGRYAPPSKSRFILRRVSVYYRRSYHHHSHRGNYGHRSHSRSYHRPPGRGSWRSLRRPVAVGGSTGRIRFLSVHFSSGKRGSAHHSLRRRVACYPILRTEAPEHSPWRAPREDLNNSSYQQFSV